MTNALETGRVRPTIAKKAPALSETALPPDDGFIDRILGDRAFLRIGEACELLRVSKPSLYRAMRRGFVSYRWNAGRRTITHAEMRRLLREGIGRISDNAA